MKKVMFYINAIHDGGAERVMVNLARYFSENEYDVILVTSFRDSWEYPVAKTVRRLSLEDREIKQSRLKRNVSRIKKLRDLCKKENPDILISFMAEPNFRAILATRGLPVKTLVSVRNDPNKEYAGKMGRMVGKVLLPMADGCVFQTEDARKWFPKRLQKKSRIIYNAVREDFYQIERTPVRGEIVTCGRLVEQKNHAMLIDAFAEVVKEFPFATLKIYGEGQLRDTLQRQIDRLGLTEKAFLMGATNDVGKALKTADLFVLSSDYEGMPNALMEAMAAGIPCIATDCPCGGPKELLNNYKVGLFEVGNTKELSMRINRILGSDNERTQMSSYLRMCSLKFAPDKVKDNWRCYVELITCDKEYG